MQHRCGHQPHAPSEQEAAGRREGHGRDTAHDPAILKLGKLVVAPQVEQTAGAVVTASAEARATRHKIHGVDIRHVAFEGHGALACANVPQLGGAIA